MQNPEKTQFGEKTVNPQEKTSLVHGVFDSVASKYDIMNDAMSGGLHRLWKNRLIRMIRPRDGQRFLDVAGGTGDIAFRIRKELGDNPDITICDLTPAMLFEGKKRAIDQGFIGDFDWSCGNAESLPFPNDYFDVYTIAFGLRNVTHIDDALAEACRVLKPGGRFFCLEFSRVKEPVLAQIYKIYSDKIIPKLGMAIADDMESYQYLVESIRKFPSQRQLSMRMEQADFQSVSHTNMTAGVVAIHQGIKI